MHLDKYKRLHIDISSLSINIFRTGITLLLNLLYMSRFDLYITLPISVIYKQNVLLGPNIHIKERPFVLFQFDSLSW